MTEYHKIHSVYKRDPETNNKRFLMGEYSLPEFRYLRYNDWVGTEKINGTCCRVWRNRIGGKSDNTQLHNGLVEVLQSVSGRMKEVDLPDDTLLYGEGYGVKIQSGRHYLPNSQGFALFDVVIDGRFQPRAVVEDIASKLGITVVPTLAIMSLVDWVEAIAQGEYKDSVLHEGARNEGVVLRPLLELKTRGGNRVITKLKFKDFGL